MRALLLCGGVACLSLLLNAALWIERGRMQDHVARLEEEVDTLTAARAADAEAWAEMEQRAREAREYAAEQYAKLDVLEEAMCLGLSDSELLDSLFRLLPTGANCARRTAAEPAGTPAGAGNAGGAGKKQ